MRLAVLYDIHGNLPALEAVLDDLRDAPVDRIVVGGDVLLGPMPHPVLQRLLSLDRPVDFIHGNCETAVLDHLAGRTPRSVPSQYHSLIRWNAEQLDRAEREAVASWPMTRRLDVPPIGTALFCHATPRNDNEIFTERTPADRLIALFEPLDVSLVVCGHTHMPFDRIVGSTRVVNAGSVGMPFGNPGADWLLVGPDVELRHTEYDLEAAAERIRGSGYPGAEEFATKYVLNPPPADAVLAAYAQHELT
jgi:predicted phosphodiesterase